MPGRRRVLFRRVRRKGEGGGVSLPKLNRSSLEKAWKSLSSKEKDRLRRLAIEKFYSGSFSAFKKDAESNPYKVLKLMISLASTEAVKPAETVKTPSKVEKAPKKPEKAEKRHEGAKLDEEKARRLHVLEDWLERLRKTGTRDPRNPSKSLPPDHPLTVLQARKVEAEIKLVKGEITDEEYRRTVEKLDEEIKKVEKALESEKPVAPTPEAKTLEKPATPPAEAKPEAPAVEKTPEAKTKPEIGYYVFLRPEELKLLSDEELESYRRMMEEHFWLYYREPDDEWAEKYRSELDLIQKEKGRRFVENARREILDALAVDTSGMTLEELEDYVKRIDQIKRKHSFPPKELVEDLRRLTEKKSGVERRIRELREVWKTSLVEKAKAGTLTYAETPDYNPFTLSWSSSPTEKEKLEAQNWELLHPYVAAKERTKSIVEIMRGLGEEPDVEKVFQDYVKFFKGPSDARTSEKDPYIKYWELNAKAHELVPMVKSLAMKRLVVAGDAQPSTVAEELPTEDREAARLAVVKWLKEEEGKSFRVKDFRTGRIKTVEELEPKDWIILPEGWGVKGVWLEGFKTGYAESVAGKALSALEELVGRPELYINVKGSRGYVEQMNGSHTTMFKGEIDLGVLDLEPGHYRVDLGWSKSTLKNPHAIVKTSENRYLFMRFKDEDVDESEVVFERLKEPPEEVPEPKVGFDGYVRLPVRLLKGLLKDASDYDLVRIEAKDGDIRIDHVARDSSVSTLKKEDIAGKGVFDCTAPQSKSHYSAGELKKLISRLSPSADITIRWAQDKPMKIELEDEKLGLSGEYWIAPYVEG